MKTLFTNKFSEKNKIALILVLFFIVMFIWHFNMNITSDDLVNIQNKLPQMTFFEIFNHYFNVHGKIFTDVFGILLLKLPYILWKIFDSLIYVIIAFLITYIFSEVSSINLLVTCALLLTYPRSYLDSAGYIMTTSNYLYPFLGILLAYIPLKYNGKHRTIIIILAILSAAYACNQDQYAMALIGSLMLYYIYLTLNKDKNNIKHICLTELIISIIFYIGMFFIPGHLIRTFGTGHGRFSIPDYDNWTLWRKIYHGYSATAANIIYQRCNIYLIVIFIIFILAILSDSKLKKIIGTIPLIITILIKSIGYSKFLYYYDYCCGLPDLRFASDIKGLITIAVSLIAIAALIAALILLINNNKMKWISIISVIIAWGSRIMMGFSATLYGSSFRTFSLMLYSFMILAFILINEVREKKNAPAFYACISAILLSFVF